MKKILITTGGTGGHVIPAKVIEENLRNNFEVYFSTDLRGKKYLSHVSNKIFINEKGNKNKLFNFGVLITTVLYFLSK